MVTADRPLRIALLSYRSKPHCGGQGVYVRHLSRELDALGHRVEVFSGQPYPDLDPGPRLTEVPSLDLYRDGDPFRTPRWGEYRDWADVTDYGLARARAAAGETFSTSSDPSRSIVVSSGGGTPAYWSPEQAAGLPLTRKTDIWSWGVSVLEMFAGEMTWISGQGAAEVLEQHLRQDRHDEAIPAMPGRLSELLRQCFCEKPGERPTSLGEVADRLKAIYRESLGIVYSRTLNAIERAASHKDRRTRVDPQEWLRKALRAADRDPAEAARIVAPRGITRQGKLVAEIAVYEEAKQLYCALVRDGQKTLEQDLAALCCDKAIVHQTASDMHGALQEYDHAIAIRQRLVNQEGRWELANGLLKVYMSKAVALRLLHDTRGAVALYDQAIAIHERLVNQEGRWELANDLAGLYMDKAAALRDLGDTRGVLALYDQALVIRERLVNQEGRWELANGLATTYGYKARAVRDLGDNRGAVALYDQEIAIRERLVNQEGRCELADDLATTYKSKAVALRALGDARGALALDDQAMAIRERLVNQEGRREQDNVSPITYMSKAVALRILGDERGALALYDQAQVIYERLVNQEGRCEANLAALYMIQGLRGQGSGRQSWGAGALRSGAGDSRAVGEPGRPPRTGWGFGMAKSLSRCDLDSPWGKGERFAGHAFRAECPER